MPNDHGKTDFAFLKKSKVSDEGSPLVGLEGFAMAAPWGKELDKCIFASIEHKNKPGLQDTTVGMDKNGLSQQKIHHNYRALPLSGLPWEALRGPGPDKGVVRTRG